MNQETAQCLEGDLTTLMLHRSVAVDLRKQTKAGEVM